MIKINFIFIFFKKLSMRSNRDYAVCTTRSIHGLHCMQPMVIIRIRGSNEGHPRLHCGAFRAGKKPIVWPLNSKLEFLGLKRKERRSTCNLRFQKWSTGLLTMINRSKEVKLLNLVKNLKWYFLFWFWTIYSKKLKILHTLYSLKSFFIIWTNTMCFS